MSIRVAITGVGNCASSLVQGVEYYKDTADDEKIPGLMHNNFGGYRVRDIEFVAAFDVDALKVGKDLSEAIFASQNNTIKFSDVPDLGVEVLRGPTYDGLGEYYRQMIDESDAEPVDVASVLREKQVDVLVSYLPVGSEQADKAYAQAAMDAGCAFVNCLPVFIAYGSRRAVVCCDKDGKASVKKYIEMKAVTDERICDGFYYASAFKIIKRHVENPELLEQRPEQVYEDID